MFFDATSNTLAVAGTSSIGDVLTDLTIPLGLLKSTPRYQDALNTWLRLGKPNLTGHSLGGLVVDQIAQSHPDWTGSARLYGAPRVTWQEADPRIKSFRHWLDPVSLFDRAAESSLHLGNPHSY